MSSARRALLAGVLTSAARGAVTAAPSFRHHPFYCEENVFHLCREPHFAGRSPAAVFVTGEAGFCLMWHQRQAKRPGQPITWDYHVFLLARAPWEVWDLDSDLGAPIPASTYLRESFRPELPLPAQFSPRFRLVGRQELETTFASDRSHMRTASGRFQKPPPPWPPIGGEGATSSLARFLDMEDPIAGEILGLAALLGRVIQQ
jgi:protein N-terminal glutamine amidohydrolase